MNAAHVHLVVNHLPLFAAMFGGVVVTLVAAGWTANLGGRIRHPEIVGSVNSGDTADFTEMEQEHRESGEPDGEHR
jgi:uncharacterized membrane protein YagU involved in acid resistance